VTALKNFEPDEFRVVDLQATQNAAPQGRARLGCERVAEWQRQFGDSDQSYFLVG
jgi:hypothetical protein